MARTPKQQSIVNNFGQLVAKTQNQKKESEYHSILKDAEPLTYKRELQRLQRNFFGEIERLSSKLASLEQVM